MYVDAILDRKNDKVLVVERVNGERVYRSFPAPYVFYYEHPSGGFRTIYGDPCKRIACQSESKFKRQLDIVLGVKGEYGRKPGKPKQVFESDVNPVFRALEDEYSDGSAPNLQIAFFDIEVDFDPQRGFAPTDDPFNPITAISVYRKWENRLYTVALAPPTMTLGEARAAVHDIPDVVVFDNEKELIRSFVDLIEDADALSGWNCIPKTQNVWLADRIVPLGQVATNDATSAHGAVVRYFESGLKRLNRLVLDNGRWLEASDEHRIPVMFKRPSEYKYPSSLEATRVDKTVAEIKAMMESGLQVYVEQKLRRNTNADLTYRDVVLTSFDTLMAESSFDVMVQTPDLQSKALEICAADGTLPQKFPYRRKITMAEDYPGAWMSKQFPGLLRADLIDQVRAQDSLRLDNERSSIETVDLTAALSAEVCRLLGFIFTDGSWDRKRNTIALYNTDLEALARYRDIALANFSRLANAAYPIDLPKRDETPCGCVKFQSSPKIRPLLGLIYDATGRKCLNVHLLSRLSAGQFAAFFAGMVDGDGYVTANSLNVCNFDACCEKLAELLNWNGVYTTSSKEYVRVPMNAVNAPFLASLDLFSKARRAAAATLRSEAQSNSPSKRLRRYLWTDRAIVRLRQIDATDMMVEMADIETEAHHFHCGGVLVHNCEGFDRPYLVNRTRKVLGEDFTRQFSLWNQLPRKREYQKFGKSFETYEFPGRATLDYLLLYQKHNPQQLHSYRLDYVGEIEVGENKTAYDGTLDALYKHDFAKFIVYNRQDTALLNKIDEKKRFIELANQMAHSNCVLLKTTMGTVSLVEQAILKDLHQMNLVAPDRQRTVEERADPGRRERLADSGEDQEEVTPVVGAYVAKPSPGVHEHVGAFDINSLYPSAIRALNMSPETIVAQIRCDETMQLVERRIADGVPRAEAWDGIFQSLEVDHILSRDSTVLTADFDRAGAKTMQAWEWHDYILNPHNSLCITANGTLFRTDRDGVIPLLLGKWYANRRLQQARQAQFDSLPHGVELPDGLAGRVSALLGSDHVPAVDNDAVLSAMIDCDDAHGIASFMRAHRLALDGSAIRAPTPAVAAEMAVLAAFYDKRQLATKIVLNSTYGALLNPHFRLYDPRLGQSTTLTGRAIVRHMTAETNKHICGEYDYLGASVKYNDTDSVYFSAYEALKDDPEFADYTWTRENIIELYDSIVERVNHSFAPFMDATFHTGLARGALIKAGRELVASKALFIKKKKYACLMYDKEGKRLDLDGKPGKLKVMGLDLKRADTPKFMQQFLEKLLMDFLTNTPRDQLFAAIRSFRKEFKGRPAWEKGTPKKVNGVGGFAKQLNDARAHSLAHGAFRVAAGKRSVGKVIMPGHVRASINWNQLRKEAGDHYAMEISDGSKVIVCKLRPNMLGMDSIAYPIDELRLPDWFKALPFDEPAMEEAIIDAKLGNLFGVLDWDLRETKEREAVDVFGF